LDGPATIESVEPNSPAARAGVTAGQTIVALDGQPIETGWQATYALLQIQGADKQLEMITNARRDPYRWGVAGALPRSNPIHPTQLYSAIDAGLLCLLLLAYDPFRRREGELVALTMTLHPISRFLIEVIRIDESAVFGTGLSISQNISIAVFLGGLACWWIVLRQPQKA
jgi:phosphatidylglycerol:prolipoprotein diacylglycerol transferase